MTRLSFNALRAANMNRQQEWPGNDKADVMFRALEVCGEAGELAEALKKYTRAERGIEGSTATLADVADEMGDVVIALDLLAEEMGIDLGCAVVEKFNLTSEKYDRRTRIHPAEGIPLCVASRPAVRGVSRGVVEETRPSVKLMHHAEAFEAQARAWGQAKIHPAAAQYLRREAQRMKVAADAARLAEEGRPS